MLNISVFGENSYIGNEFALFLEKRGLRAFGLSKINSRRETYNASDFSEADCVLYCAGIAHRKAADELHYRINCDLALEAAKAARQAGVKQFVYLSSAAVFGRSSGVITPAGVPCPDSAYGKSKLKAETELKMFEDEKFIVTIVRPPMVYGYGCKGNFEKLVKLTRLTPVFPDVENRRSMIYIENLCHFLVSVIERQESGVFFPQNTETICTTELVRTIARNLGKNIHFIRLFNGLIPLFMGIAPLEKLFGDFVYESTDFERIGLVEFEESVRRSLEHV